MKLCMFLICRFVVATQRVRGASKKTIPHINDHVSKLTALGKASQGKLLDMFSVALEAGILDLPLELRSVTTVGKFCALMQWAEADPSREATLKRALKLAKGWEEARDHAFVAVSDDFSVRLFYSNSELQQGLVFRSVGGIPDIDDPIATFSRLEDKDSGEERIVIYPRPMKDGLSKLISEIKKAKASWFRPFHPGWGILAVDSDILRHRLQMEGVVSFSDDIACKAKPFANPSPLVVLNDSNFEIRKVLTGFQSQWIGERSTSNSQDISGKNRDREAAMRDHANTTSYESIKKLNRDLIRPPNNVVGVKRNIADEKLPARKESANSNQNKRQMWNANDSRGDLFLRQHNSMGVNPQIPRRSMDSLETGSVPTFMLRSMPADLGKRMGCQPGEVYGSRILGSDLDETMLIAELLRELQQRSDHSLDEVGKLQKKIPSRSDQFQYSANGSSLNSIVASLSGDAFKSKSNAPIGQTVGRKSSKDTQNDGLRIEALMNDSSLKQIAEVLSGKISADEIAPYLSNFLSIPTQNNHETGRPFHKQPTENQKFRDSYVVKPIPKGDDVTAAQTMRMLSSDLFGSRDSARTSFESGALNKMNFGQEHGGNGVNRKWEEGISNAVWQKLMSELPFMENRSVENGATAQNTGQGIEYKPQSNPAGASRTGFPGHNSSSDVPAAITVPSAKSGSTLSHKPKQEIFYNDDRNGLRVDQKKY